MADSSLENSTPTKNPMFAVIAAILFGIALLLELFSKDFGSVINATSLTTAGLLCLALHLCGLATALPRRGFRRR
jgi:hypothetical protein